MRCHYSKVARCERHAKESARMSFWHIVGFDQVKKKIHPHVFVNLHIGGHLEIKGGRHPENNNIVSMASDISFPIFFGPRNMIMTLF